MASDFPAYVARGIESTVGVEMVPGTGSGEPFVPGSFVTCSTGESSEVELCGTDPALIAGISEVNSTYAATITPNGRVPIRLITNPNTVVGMCSATTPASTHVGVAYGISKLSSGNWSVLTSETTSTKVRVRVVGVDEAKGIFFCVLNPAALQFGLSIATA